MAALKDQEKYLKRVLDLSRMDPHVLIRLDGKDYKLEYTMYSAKLIKDELGIDMLKPIDYEQGRDFGNLFGLIRHGLAKHHPELSEEDIQKIVSPRMFMYYAAIIREAMDLMYPPEEEGAAREGGDDPRESLQETLG